MSLSQDERLLVQRGIASIIDSPSVYMGGPSPQAMKKADRIIADLEQGARLVSTTCDHSGWKCYRTHGLYCPDCGTVLPDRSPSQDSEAGNDDF